ncbi:MAG: hypothetical protein WCG94_03350, partial [Methanothrix sp.]
MPDGLAITDWVSVVTGIAALTAAVYFAHRQTVIQEKQVGIAKEQADIARQQLIIIENQEQEILKEKRKANLVAWIEQKSNAIPAQSFLVIQNNGPADARNITSIIDGTSISKHRDFVSSLDDIVSQLSSGSKIKYRMVLTGNHSGVFNLEIIWDD